VLTKAGVSKVAAMLRQRRETGGGSSVPVEGVETPEAPPEGGGGAPERDAGGCVMATVLRQQNLPNRRMLRCRVGEKEVPVLVRDTGFYRQGETFGVVFNSVGQWEAALHRSQPRFR